MTARPQPGYPLGMPIPPNSHLAMPVTDAPAELTRATAAGLIARGVTRCFAAHGVVSLPEFTLRSGRRADLFCLDAKSRVTIVEIKSSIEDFRSDQKWPDYLEYCDRFYFAVPERFPREMLPEDQGLMIADGYGATVVREAADLKLSAARRRTLVLQFAQQAAQRLQVLSDPESRATSLDSL